MSQPTRIADLSYRNYDGPKTISATRWWSITKNGLRMNIRKKNFWTLAVFCALPYFIMVVNLFFTQTIREFQRMQLPLETTLSQYYGGKFIVFFVMFFAMLVGAGSIAADNRANALQIYLSKAITKFDYLVGKWLSIFIPVYAVVFVPAFLAITYAALDQGVVEFFKQHPTLHLRLFLLAAIPAAFHASMLCGISAWNKTPWVVGVIYIALVFFTDATVNIVVDVIEMPETQSFTLRHLSLLGIISGLGYHAIGSAPAEFDFRSGIEIPSPPDFPPLFAVYIVCILLSLLLAYSRIRAVEVVQG